MSEFDYDAGYDPSIYDVAEVDPASLAAVAQQAAEVATARVLGEVVQAQQQQTQFNIDQQAQATLAQAERALRAHDSNWDSLRPYAAATVTQHPSLLSPEALFDPEIAAENLWNAAQAGVSIENDARAQAKAADDEQAFQRIKSEASKSWSARMADAGAKSVHDILDS